MTRNGSLSWCEQQLVFNQDIYEGLNHLCTRRPGRMTDPLETQIIMLTCNKHCVITSWPVEKH